MTYGSPASRCILIADDDQDIRELLRLYLESEGYRVREAVDGAEALGAVKAGGIDLVLLDIMMPRIDGYQVLRRLRETSALPVIMVSAKGQDPDKIIGLDLGADDYLTKPFNPLEALARVRSCLRRAYGMPAGASPDDPSAKAPLRAARVLSVRDLTLDLDACVLHRGDEPLDLTPVEFRMLSLFMSHPGRVFTKQQIFEEGWGEEYVASGNNVMVGISKLRAKLSDDPGAYIATVRGLGYRMEA